jgi:hypothetical protein
VRQVLISEGATEHYRVIFGIAQVSEFYDTLSDIKSSDKSRNLRRPFKKQEGVWKNREVRWEFEEWSCDYGTLSLCAGSCNSRPGIGFSLRSKVRENGSHGY